LLTQANSGSGHEAALGDARMVRIVRVLTDNAMLVVSGTKLANEIGTSRSEVWRLVEQLRALGVAIAGHPAEGYRLQAVPDLLLPDVVAPLVKGTIFDRHIHHSFKTESTNELALDAAHAGAAEGTVFLAEEQTAGRGRGGHSWHSEPGTGVYCSVVLRPHLAPADALVISLMSGLAAAAAVEEVTGLKPDLRWPNDLLITRSPSPDVPNPGGTRKFAGILIELNAEPTRVRHVVIGIGINVNHESFPPEIEPIATSLRIESGRRWSRVDVAAALLRAIDREYRALPHVSSANVGHQGLDSARRDIFRRFEQASSYARGRRVTVEEDNGYRGITEGLDDRGFLRVRAEGGVKTVLHGGVRADEDADAGKF
jgi:BirA family transcriptional regulator, biotin operon repressor / biotin---[acetyl-CoA-carboxylase] ligase